MTSLQSRGEAAGEPHSALPQLPAAGGEKVAGDGGAAGGAEAEENPAAQRSSAGWQESTSTSPSKWCPGRTRAPKQREPASSSPSCWGTDTALPHTMGSAGHAQHRLCLSNSQLSPLSLQGHGPSLGLSETSSQPTLTCTAPVLSSWPPHPLGKGSARPGTGSSELRFSGLRWKHWQSRLSPTAGLACWWLSQCSQQLRHRRASTCHGRHGERGCCAGAHPSCSSMSCCLSNSENQNCWAKAFLGWKTKLTPRWCLFHCSAPTASAEVTRRVCGFPVRPGNPGENESIQPPS